MDLIKVLTFIWRNKEPYFLRKSVGKGVEWGDTVYNHKNCASAVIKQRSRVGHMDDQRPLQLGKSFLSRVRFLLPAHSRSLIVILFCSNNMAASLDTAFTGSLDSGTVVRRWNESTLDADIMDAKRLTFLRTFSSIFSLVLRTCAGLSRLPCVFCALLACCTSLSI